MKAILSVFIYPIMGLSLISCEAKINSNELEKILNRNSKQKRTVNKKAPGIRTAIGNKAELLGIWDNVDHGSLAIEIGEDSIYYVDSFESYSWRLRQDSISIQFPGYVSISKGLISGDTLILISNIDSSRYVRKVD